MHHVALRVGREALLPLELFVESDLLLLEELGRVHVAVHVLLRAELDRAAGSLLLVGRLGGAVPADEGRVNVDQVLDGQTAVDEALDLLVPVALGVAADPRAVVGHLVHHLAVGVLEPEVVLEEVRVSAHVGHDQLLVEERVAPHQVGVDRVVVDDQLVDLAESVFVGLGELLVLHPPLPVGIASREPAEGGDLVQLVVVEELKADREEVEPVARGLGLDHHGGAGQLVGEVSPQLVPHG